MTEEIAYALIGGLGALVFALVSYIWMSHVRRSENHLKTAVKPTEHAVLERRVKTLEERIEAINKIAAIETLLKRAVEDIGDHETGIRGRLHDLANMVNRHGLWLDELRHK